MISVHSVRLHKPHAKINGHSMIKVHIPYVLNWESYEGTNSASLVKHNVGTVTVHSVTLQKSRPGWDTCQNNKRELNAMYYMIH